MEVKKLTDDQLKKVNDQQRRLNQSYTNRY